MTTLLTPSAASVFIVVDETDAATLTQLAQATGRAVSTMQRAVDGLLEARALVRDAARGPVRVAPDAPRRALRELAEWQLGASAAKQLRAGAREVIGAHGIRVPSTIANPVIRAAWPSAIEAIVGAVDPMRILLFGSQARGDARPDSDVDLLVVFDRPVDKREIRNEVGRALARMPFGKDILVAEIADLERPMPGTALIGAVREGVLVHER